MNIRIALLAILGGIPIPLFGVELKLTEKGEFGEIFDSGLRPTRLRGMGYSTCVVDHVPISLKVGDTTYPEILVERMRIDVLKNHKMVEVVAFREGNLTLVEAKALAIEWGAPKDEVETRDLEEYSWHLIDPNDQWRVGAGFLKTYNDEKPVRFGFSTRWLRPRRELEFHQGLLPPPPGYEHVSMESPGDPSPPKTGSSGEEGEATVRPSRRPGSSGEADPDHDRTQRPVSHFKRLYPFGLAAILFFLILAWLRHRNKTNHREMGAPRAGNPEK